MPRAIGEFAQRLLDYLPPYLANDEAVRGAMVAIGNEAQLLDDAASELRDKMFPSQADDEYNTLSIWEAMLGMPVKPIYSAATPVPLTIAERRAKVMANIKRRNSPAGSDWVAAIDETLSGVTWSYIEGPGPYTVTLTLPAGWPLGAIKSLVRRITPAHIHVVVGYGGFVVGVGTSDPLPASPIGEGLI